MPKPSSTVFVILGNQLFPREYLADHRDAHFFMAEDFDLCTYVKHHKLKIILFLASMRAYAEELDNADFNITYEKLDKQTKKDTYEKKLTAFIKQQKATQLVTFEIEDKFFEQRIIKLADKLKIDIEFLPSPMFLTPRETFADYVDGKKRPFMASFYQQQRKRLNILVDEDGQPRGGQWSFDEDNRKKLPKKQAIPGVTYPNPNDHIEPVKQLVEQHFNDHPGEMNDIWFPTTRRQALGWFRQFLDERFHLFGDYEDALSTRDPWLFHSALTPCLNLGLITPQEIVNRALEHAEQNDIPLNALEGFIRQIIGWREFIRGIYQNYSEQQDETNFFNHTRNMTEHWYDGTTGLLPLDDAIHKANQLGWTHHIERLMVLSNLMNLCEIKPKQAHDWFMTMFVDSSDWVMGPNVYGMGLMSDGGIFATKPYICGSNYIFKMSDYSKPKKNDTGNVFAQGDADWATTMDGLYWRFVDKHRQFFDSNARMTMMTRSLDRMDSDKKQRIFAAAEVFIEKVTY